jgi:hypothetical protein
MANSTKQSEEAKRDRHIDRDRRQQMLEEAAFWLDAQQSVPRNSIAGCLANQARLNAQLKDWQNHASK